MRRNLRKPEVCARIGMQRQGRIRRLAGEGNLLFFERVEESGNLKKLEISARYMRIALE